MKILQRKIVGLDIHDYSVELVEFNVNNKAISLEAFNVMSLPEKMIVNGEIEDAEGLKVILQNLFKTANPRPVMTKNIAVSFPPSKVLTHIFTLAASLNEREIRKALPFEAESIIPYSFEDIYWDFTILRKDAADKKRPVQTVLFACITKDVADRYTGVFESVGLSPMAFGINAESLKNSVLKQTAKDKTYLQLDIGTLSVDYLIIRNNTILEYFSLNESGQKLLAGLEEVLHKSREEIFDKKEDEYFYTQEARDKTLKFIGRCYKKGMEMIESYEKGSTDGTVDGIILTGEFLNLPQFHPLAVKTFAGRQIIIGDPKKNLIVDDGKFHSWKDSQDDLKNKPTYAISYTNAIGVALTELKNSGINLLPSRLKEGFEKQRTSLLMATASVIMSILAVLIATFMVIALNNLNYEKKILQINKSAIQQIIMGTRYRELNDHIVAFNNEVNILSGIDKNLFSLKDVIGSVFGSMPEGIRIDAWTFSDSESLFRMNGIADNRDSLLKMQKILGQNEYISSVIAPISNYDKKTEISFALVLNLDPLKLPRYVTNAQ